MPTLTAAESIPSFTVLAIHGTAQVGKTTLAEMLVNNRLPRTTRPVQRLRVSFGGPIKTVAQQLFDWDGDKTLYKLPDGRIDLAKGRGLVIGVGNAVRATYPDVWADLTVRQIGRRVWTQTSKGAAMGLPVPMTVFIIDDLRLPNEVAVLKKAFPGNIRFIRMERAAGLTGIDDVTERGLDGFSEWYRDLDNNGSLEVLGHHADDILDHIIPIS